MIIPEPLKKYASMSDEEQQARCREIGEIIQRLTAAGLIPYQREEKRT